MNNFKIVFDVILKLLDTRLYFAPFSFTILQFMLSLLGLSIAVFIIRELFSSD